MKKKLITTILFMSLLLSISATVFAEEATSNENEDATPPAHIVIKPFCNLPPEVM